MVSEAAHYSNRSIAGWLGIGTEQLHAIPTDSAMAMRLDLLAEKLEELHREGVRVGFVTATFGTTDAFGVDDVAGIRRILGDYSQRNAVPEPQLHVDAAVGWVLSFLAEYDTARNPLDFSPELLAMVQRVQQQTLGLREADSITIDFHKMGWGHYPSSAFLVNRRSDLRHLARPVADMPYFSEADARRDPALFTLECSRPGLGPYTVMASLNGIGLTGWQLLVARSLELADRLKQRLEQLEYCKVLNLQTTGPSVVWWVLPKGRDAKEIFRAVTSGELPAEKFAHYAGRDPPPVRQAGEGDGPCPGRPPLLHHEHRPQPARHCPARLEGRVLQPEDRRGGDRSGGVQYRGVGVGVRARQKPLNNKPFQAEGTGFALPRLAPSRDATSTCA